MLDELPVEVAEAAERRERDARSGGRRRLTAREGLGRAIRAARRTSVPRDFGRSIETDAELAIDDIAGSIAHVRGLERAGVLTAG